MLRAGIALHRLAQAHERRGDAEQAAYYYEMNLHRMDAEQVAGSEAVDALMFLAAYHKVLHYHHFLMEDSSTYLITLAQP